MMPYRLIKLGIWLYFWLILLEGVLRKWVFPAWSDVIFVIRDPLVVIIYLLALRAGVFPWRPAILIAGLIATASLAAAAFTDNPLVLTAFGMRTNYLHLPLAFIMAAVLDRRDVLSFGRATIIASVPIVALMVVQFDSPPDAVVNAGAGGSAHGQLRGALGKIRPPGPFSFISGIVSFFGLVMAYALYGWAQRGMLRWIWVVMGSVTVAIAIPISISRSLSFALLVVLFFAVPVFLRDVRRMPIYLGPAAVVAGLALSAFDTVYVQAFVVRWQESLAGGDAGFAGGVIGRIMDSFLQPFEFATTAPLVGHGIGLGTVAGARLTTGSFTFLLAESELARLVLELGPVLGFAFIAWRGWLALMMVWTSWRHFRTEGDSLAWLLAGASFLSVFSGQWGPSTNLGFAIFGAGLTLGALNPPEEDDEEADEESHDPGTEAETG